MKAPIVALAFTLFLASTALAPPALAEPPSADPTAERAPKRKGDWYGWQIAVIDAASLVAGTVAITQTGQDGGGSSLGFGSVAFAGYLLGGPIVHLAHRDVRPGAVGSFALRLGGPIIGAGTGILLGLVVGSLLPDDCKGSDWCIPPAFGYALVGYLVGLPAGALAASVLDISLLSFEPPPRTGSAGFRATQPLALAPSIALPRDAGGRTAPTFTLAAVF